MQSYSGLIDQAEIICGPIALSLLHSFTGEIGVFQADIPPGCLPV